MLRCAMRMGIFLSNPNLVWYIKYAFRVEDGKMMQDEPIKVAYAFRNGAHSFRAVDPRTGEIAISHGVPEVAYEEVTRTLTSRVAGTFGQYARVLPQLSFSDFWTWLQMNPIAAMPNAPCHVEFAWEIRQ